MYLVNSRVRTSLAYILNQGYIYYIEEGKKGKGKKVEEKGIKEKGKKKGKRRKRRGRGRKRRGRGGKQMIKKPIIWS